MRMLVYPVPSVLPVHLLRVFVPLRLCVEFYLGVRFRVIAYAF